MLGDIDAEALTVTATDATGGAVTGADLGASAFNYCGTPANATCAGGLATPNPTVDTTATSVTAADPLCPPTDCNTSGAALSLQPTVPLATLTVTSSWRQGFPSYQAWFATRTAALTGRVTAPCALTTPPTARLLDAGGNVVTTSPTGSGETYAFNNVAAGPYRVDVDPATLPTNASAEPVDIDASSGDATAPDITVHTRVTVAGTVQRSTGAAAGPAVVANLPVTLTSTSGASRQTTTDADGRYAFDQVTDGQYRISVEPVGQDTITPREQTVIVACDEVEAPAFSATAATPTSPSPTPTPTTSTASSGGSASSTAPSPPDTTGSAPANVPRHDGADRAGLADTGSPLRLVALLALLAIGAGLLSTGTVMAYWPAQSHRSQRVLNHRTQSTGRHR